MPSREGHEHDRLLITQREFVPWSYTKLPSWTEREALFASRRENGHFEIDEIVVLSCVLCFTLKVCLIQHQTESQMEVEIPEDAVFEFCCLNKTWIKRHYEAGNEVLTE